MFPVGFDVGIIKRWGGGYRRLLIRIFGGMSTFWYILADVFSAALCFQAASAESEGFPMLHQAHGLVSKDR